VNNSFSHLLLLHLIVSSGYKVRMQPPSLGDNAVSIVVLVLLDGNDNDDDDSSFFFLRLVDRRFDFDETVAHFLAVVVVVVVVVVSFAWGLSSSSSLSSLDRFLF